MEVKEIPLVSIAIITYNQKEYLKECIESVLEQDYENIEIVVADDCSTDGTQEMLKGYEEKYPNKFVLKLSDRNQGITKNSNLAHFACKGKYIAWMGGDDLMLPGKIRRQVEYMENNPECTICYHNLDVFQSDTNETLYYFNENNKYEGDVRVVIKYGTFNGGCSNMVRADKVPKNGFNETLPIASDWLFWCECLLNGGTINYIDEVLGRYRRHQKNITAKKKLFIK
jgi:glycosyltransferase involved in cell wall biosynthesis